MKKEWKVYIKGVQGRGDEVIKTLDDRGGRKHGFLSGADPEMLYYISHDGDITSIYANTETGQIMMDNYRELHLTELWKDGDILICRECKLYVVTSHIYTDCKIFIACIQAAKDNVQEYKNGLLCSKEDYRLATDKEVNEFYEILHKHGVDWDAKKKQLVDWRWKPKEKEIYWIICPDGRLSSGTFDNDDFDNDSYNFGNCFRTKEEAEAAVERVKKALKG